MYTNKDCERRVGEAVLISRVECNQPQEQPTSVPLSIDKVGHTYRYYERLGNNTKKLRQRQIGVETTKKRADASEEKEGIVGDVLDLPKQGL